MGLPESQRHRAAQRSDFIARKSNPLRNTSQPQCGQPELIIQKTESLPEC